MTAKLTQTDEENLAMLGMPTFDEFKQGFARDFPGLVIGSFNDSAGENEKHWQG